VNRFLSLGIGSGTVLVTTFKMRSSFFSLFSNDLDSLSPMSRLGLEWEASVIYRLAGMWAGGGGGGGGTLEKMVRKWGLISDLMGGGW
jgi:hypothetical protein